MNSPAIIRFSKPTFYLVIFCIFSLLSYLPWASSQQDPTWCADQFQCGRITAGFPFWGGKRQDYCGLQLLGLHCSEDNRTSLVISDQEYSVLDGDHASYTLTLARTDLLGPFCSAKFINTTLPPDIFELSPSYKNLIVSYVCNPEDHYLSSNFTCLDMGIVSVTQDPWTQHFCNESFTVNVPMDYYPDERESDLNLDLERVLREGFEVKVEIDEITCQACSSSGGICSFKGTTQVCCKTNSRLGISCEQKLQRSAAELHNLCSTPFICGNQGGLLYPLWIPGREECGHPDFKLNCNGGFAELNISSVIFRILEVNYDASIIRLVRLDSIGDLCDPQYPSDTPFNKIALPFAPNTELLTIYYTCILGCSRICYPSFVSTYVGKLDCEDGYGENYNVTRNLSSPLLQGIRGQLYKLSVSCRKNISFRASGPALKTLENNKTIGNLKNAIEGFELGVDQDCSRCRGSGGACGYDHITRRFVCYSGSRHKGISSRAKIVSTVFSKKVSHHRFKQIYQIQAVLSHLRSKRSWIFLMSRRLEKKKSSNQHDKHF